MFNSCLLQLSLEQNLKQLRKTLIYTSQCKTHTFRATINLLFFSLARYTRPNFPEPSGFPMSKSWSCHLFSFLVLETFVSPNHLCASLPFPPPSPHTYHLFYCLVWQLKIEWLLQLQEQKLWKKRWMVLWRWKKVGRLLACACLWETTCDKMKNMLCKIHNSEHTLFGVPWPQLAVFLRHTWQQLLLEGVWMWWVLQFWTQWCLLLHWQVWELFGGLEHLHLCVPPNNNTLESHSIWIKYSCYELTSGGLALFSLLILRLFNWYVKLVRALLVWVEDAISSSPFPSLSFACACLSFLRFSISLGGK